MPCVHHLISDDCAADVEVVSEGEDHGPRPKTPKRENQELQDDGATPVKTSRKMKEPSNADLMDFLRDMREQQNETSGRLEAMHRKQDETSAHLDHMYKIVTQRIDNHDGELARVSRAVADLNEKIDNMELSGVAQADPSMETRLKSMEEEMARRLALLEQEMIKKGPPEEPERRGPPPPSAGESDTVVIGGFKRDTPKGQIIKVYERVIMSHLQRRFVDLSSWEVYCPYLLSSVLLIRCPSASLARQAVSFLRGTPLRCKLGSEDISLWTTLQKNREQKDRSRRLMRMAAALQALFVPDAPQQETYKLVCWKSGTIVAFDRRVAQLRDETVTFFDDWHSTTRYSEPDKNIIVQQLKDILAADINSSRS